ncbi:oxaloacetate decarboxylase [Tepiditoga spiralis]|uniref:Oxaloacetate decarboxylase n=1 Tax=Tepiditoga spiralis TaxID=2108365 RepID=A0A7G1G6L6_9BACT|nr:pyruvate carboxylase subunit B [Tepiditoga spiralis]BBE30483.1 oxaloacetate decarboxylase [Tepiditoga spiralis]
MPYVVDTTLRDGQQSLIATRMKTKEFEDKLEIFDQVGYHSMEVWGGATYDSCIRYLNEDPWERLKTIRKKLKNTKIQMLLRGQNILGYRHYPDEVLELFIKKMADYGVDIVRIFDALNDIRNLEKAIEYTKKYKMHAQGAISYTVSPVHNVDFYLKYAEKLVKCGVDSIAIKDMAGLLEPHVAVELVKKLKEKFDIPIELHTHNTTGLGSLSCYAASEAGIDGLNLALSPFANGTSQPAVEPFNQALKLGLNNEKILELTEYFWKVRKNHEENDMKMTSINAQILDSQIPGGMLSNLVSQLKAQKAEDRLDEVLKEVPAVRKELGYPPLVTPTSQIVGVQATLNVLTGERYKMITNEVKNYLKGMYGRSPAPVDEEIFKKALGNEKPIDHRPADDLEPVLKKARSEMGLLAQTDEDLLTYVLFGEVGKKFLKDKYEKSLGVDLNIAKEYEDEESSIYPV